MKSAAVTGALMLAIGAMPMSANAQQALADEVERLRAIVEQSQQALEQATARIEELEGKQEEAPKQSIRAGRARDGVEAQLYGHVNQAFLFAGNGASSRFDIVDNDNSSTRFGFRGRYSSGDWSSGVRIEFNAEVNTTDELSFDADGALGTIAGGGDGEDDLLSLRWANWFISNKSFGTFNLGFGEIATQGVSEVDLSGTTLIAESDVDDTGGELQFSDGTGDLGTGFEVDDFFSNFDGFRDSAVSYVSPRLFGFQGKIAGRVDEGPDGVAQFQPDASVNYEGEIAGYEVEGAAGWRRDAGAASNNYIASASVLAPFGTNLTLGGGFEVFNSSQPESENFLYVKLGQRMKFFDFGETRFSIDFFRGRDNSQDGIGFEQTEAFSVGGGFVQQVKPLGAELYAGVRYYDVDLGLNLDADPTNNIDTDGLITVLTGARVRF